MSDRRPENPELADLRVLTDLGGFEPDDRYVRPGTRPATLADLLAVVRRGVESGTIKGKPWTWCKEHDAPGGPQDGGPWDDKCYEWWLCEVLGDECDGVTPCRIVETLVIPVSDGGEDRP